MEKQTLNPEDFKEYEFRHEIASQTCAGYRKTLTLVVRGVKRPKYHEQPPIGTTFEAKRVVSKQTSELYDCVSWQPGIGLAIKAYNRL